MYSHVVLLKPLATLTDEGRERLVAAFEHALRHIPSIRGTYIGRRVKLGTAYDAQMPTSVEYLVTLNFDDEAGLRDYLAHPAHEALGARFSDSLAAALVFDFEPVDLAALRTLR